MLEMEPMYLYFTQEQQVSARPALRVQGRVRLPGGVPARRRPAAEGRRRPAAEDPGAPGRRRHGRLARLDRPAGGAAGAVRAVLLLLRAGHADGAAAAAAAEDLLGGRATAAAALTRETSQSANLYDSILDHYIRQLWYATC